MSVRNARAFLAAATLVLLAGAGCSKDSSTPTNPNNNPDPWIYIQPVINSVFTYNRTVLDTANVPDPTTTHSYVVTMKSTNGQLVSGPYTDWIRRIGTDQLTGEKDTLYIRLPVGTSGSTNYTKEVWAYGFAHYAMDALATMVSTQFGIEKPVIPGETADVVAKFYDDSGNELANGTQWTIGDPNGSDLSFLVNFGGQNIPVTINVKFTGTLDSKGETFTVKGKTIKTWKATVTMTFSILGTPSTVKVSFWYSDDPDGQIKIVQSGSKVTIPLVGASLPIPGEMYELTDFQQ